MNTPAPFLLPFLRQTQHLHFLRRECFLHILLNFKVPNRASRVLKKSELSATFHCLSYSYPPSKCKCNERVLHLSDVAMHVDTCLPQPFLHCPLPIATFAEMNSILLCFMWDCLPKPPPPLLLPLLTYSLLLPEHLSVPHIRCCFTVQPWRLTSTNYARFLLMWHRNIRGCFSLLT